MAALNRPMALIEQHLKPLERYLKMGGEDVTDICINVPGEIHLASKTKGWKVYKDKEITEERLKMLAEVLATNSDQKFNDEFPILATHLPGYDYRCHILNRGLAYEGISYSIRKPSVDVYPLESFFEPIPGIANWRRELREVRDRHKALGDEVRPFLAECREWEALKLLMRKGGAVVICGGTSSGKTSVTNSMIMHIPMTERILTIEDVHELKLPQPNRVHIMKSKTSSDIGGIKYTDIVDSTNRMRPDRIFFGELDKENTYPFLRSINTGHRGSMATLHADNPDLVVPALVMNLQLAGFTGDERNIENYVRTLITAIVFSNCIEVGDKKYYRTEVQLLK